MSNSKKKKNTMTQVASLVLLVLLPMTGKHNGCSH